MKQTINHTSVAIHKDTKKRLDSSKAPGQCYDGFIEELVENWERYQLGRPLCGLGKSVTQVGNR